MMCARSTFRFFVAVDLIVLVVVAVLCIPTGNAMWLLALLGVYVLGFQTGGAA
jgi:hypothetical protein